MVSLVLLAISSTGRYGRYQSFDHSPDGRGAQEGSVFFPGKQPWQIPGTMHDPDNFYHFLIFQRTVEEEVVFKLTQGQEAQSLKFRVGKITRAPDLRGSRKQGRYFLNRV